MIARGKSVGQMVRLGLGGALLSLALLVSMSGLAGADPVAPEPLSTRGGICSASGDTPTGRQFAWIKESSRDPSFCIRTKLGGTADNTVPDCWAARSIYGLDCTTIIDE